MHSLILVKCPAADVDELAARLGERAGFLGLEEVSADGKRGVEIPETFRVVEFGTKRAKQWEDCLRSYPMRARADVLLKIYFQCRTPEEAKRWGAHFRKDFPHYRVSAPSSVGSVDYLQAFRDQFRGLNIGRRFWVGPPWRKPPHGKLPIIIEPGMAFGTGDHPTTRLCLKLIEQLAPEKMSPNQILDVGTGSGILAIAAAKLWPAAQLWVCDTDASCANDVTHNFSLNDLAVPPKSFWGKAAQLDRIEPPRHGFDLVIGNISIDALLPLAPQLTRLVRGDRLLIVSGLLGSKQQMQFMSACCGNFRIERTLSERSFCLEREAAKHWIGLLLKRR